MASSAVAHKLAEKQRTGDVLINENVNFEGLLLSESILKGLKSAGFERPSPIQLKAIPLGRCGLDLIVQAKSGTGKTCVFSVIALESLQIDTTALQVLVLAPTREIAIQIWDVIKSIGQVLSQLKCHTFIGGMPLQEDKQKLKKCHIAVGTPGRIKQLIEQGVMNIENIRMFVLDEADKLLEESFQEQINWIYSTLPDNKQMLALSATYPEYLAQHLTAYMRNPTFLRLNVSDPALLGIKQYYKPVKYHPLPNKLFESKVEVVTTILSSVEFQQCLVFSNLQTMAQNMTDALNSKGWPTACIAGSLDQKDRNLAMSKLKTFKCRVLISTDLTSRGIDADKVNLVINLDVPKDHETYLHRIGRAGRFGTFGACVSIVSEGQEMVNLQTVEKKCNTCISVLPEAIPVDLVKTQSTVRLDDMVSTEKLFTAKENGAILEKKTSNPNVITGSSQTKSNENVKSENSDNKISKAQEINIKGLNNIPSLVKGDNSGSPENDRLDIDEKVVPDKTFPVGTVENESRQSGKIVSDGIVNGHLEDFVQAETVLNSEAKKKAKNKQKRHTSANMWTQLIIDRKDDEEFVNEFHESQKENDTFEIPVGNVKESEAKVNDSEINTGDNNKNEQPKRKTAKRRTDEKIKKAVTTSSDCFKTKIFPNAAHNISDVKIKIPSLRDTVGLKRLQCPHIYKSAVEKCRLYRETTQNLSEQVKELKISESTSETKIISIKVEKPLSYDRDLIQKVQQVLQLSHLRTEMKSHVPSVNVEQNTITENAIKENNRKTLKATRGKPKQSKRAVKSNLSVQKLKGINIASDQVRTQSDNICFQARTEEDENDRKDQTIKPKYKNSYRAFQNVIREDRTQPSGDVHCKKNYVQKDLPKTDFSLSAKPKENLNSFFSDSELSSDSSESSGDSEDLHQTYKYYSSKRGDKKKQGRQFHHENYYPPKASSSFAAYDEETSNTDEEQTSWHDYMKHYSRCFQHHYPSYPYCYPQYQHPYMNGYNPYAFPSSWQYPYQQMYHQQSLSTYQSLYQNLEMQQKYMKMMLKNYRKIMSRE